MQPSPVSWMPVFISSLALLFTILSFWWMNWRPGKLNAGSIRFFAAGKGIEGKADSKNLVIVGLPLVLWNSGARPLLVEDLRLVSIGMPVLPELAFEAVDDKLTTFTLDREERVNRDYFFLPLALKPNEIIRANFVFEARIERVMFQAARYRLSLQVQLSAAARWRRVKEIEINFSGLDNMGLYNLNEFYSVFPYCVKEGA